MTFEQFLDKVYNVLRANADCWLSESFKDPQTHLSPRPYEGGFTFAATWCKGGSRGSYLNEDGPQPVGPDPEPECPEEFDLILEALLPNIAYLQYKNLRREVVKTGETYNSDYYGGATTEGHKGFKILDLYEGLKRRGLI